MAYKTNYFAESRFLRKDLTSEIGAGFRFDDVNDSPRYHSQLKRELSERDPIVAI
jgi:hypothetical protein